MMKQKILPILSDQKNLYEMILLINLMFKKTIQYLIFKRIHQVLMKK